MPTWRAQWNKSKTGKDLRAIDATLPSKKVLGLHSNHKPANSILIQMRTQKIGLRAFLHSRKVPGFEHDDGAVCECEEGFQTVKHVLLQCPIWQRKRVQMQKEGGEAKTRDIRRLLSDPKVTKLAVGFMVQAGLLKQYNQVDWNTVNASGN